MSAATATSAGLVPPAYVWAPPAPGGSAGGEVRALMAALGRAPDAEQELALDTLLGEREDGDWAAQEQCICEARQNGKTKVVLLGSAIYDLWIRGCELVIWTAHEYKTASKAFADLRTLVNNNEFLEQDVQHIWAGAGNQAIELYSGARFEFHARTGGSGRGFTGDSVTFDEAMYLTSDELAALMPTLSARQNPVIRYGGSAGMETSEAWRDLRDRGRRGGDEDLAWIEWCAQRRPCRTPVCTHARHEIGCALDDLELWQQANHSLDIGDGAHPKGYRRMTRRFLRTERNSMPSPEFAREILGWWDDPAGDAPISMGMWRWAADPESVSVGRPCYGFDASPRLRTSCITAASWRPDGRPHVEIIAYREGAEWAPAELKKLRRAHRGPLVMGRNSPGAALLPEITRQHLAPELFSDQEVAQACTALEKQLRGESPGFAHTGDLIWEDALEGAGAKDSGDGGWLWVRKEAVSSSDICPLVSATVALAGLRKLVRTGSIREGSYG